MSSSKEDPKLLIAFVNMVKKNPCLWNYTLNTYSRTDVTGLAWKKIAEELNDNELACRNRWKNIRTAFARSLKPGGLGKLKKPYYLSAYLEFLLPYLKGANSAFWNSAQNTESNYDITENSELGDLDTHEQSTSDTDNDELRQSEDSLTTVQNGTTSKRRLLMAKNETENNFIEWLNLKNQNETEKPSVQQTDPDLLFFQSMMPDFKKLDDRRKRTLKTRFMLLLNEQLDEVDEASNHLSNWSSSTFSAPVRSTRYHSPPPPPPSTTGHDYNTTSPTSSYTDFTTDQKPLQFN